MTHRTCEHPGCERAHDSGGYCTTHNSRIRVHGNSFGRRCAGCNRPLEEVFGNRVRSQSYCSDLCRPICSFVGCVRPSAKREWCTAHYQQQRAGVPLTQLSWEATTRGTPCAFCSGVVDPSLGMRKYCSRACQRLYLKYGGERPDRAMCALCADPIDLTAPTGKSGRRKPTVTKLCERCVVRRKFKTTVFVLASRDGTDCSICCEPIDMTLRRADSVYCPSIDHVIPRARGGTDDPENLALAHFRCNAVKSDRIGFVM